MTLGLIFNTTRPDTTGVYLERACRALEVPTRHWSLQEAMAAPAECEWYLRVDHGDDYEISLPERFRPLAFYAIDTHLPHSWRKIRKAARRCDRLFCAQRAAAERLGGEWLPFGCDPQLQAVAPNAARYDIGFVGNDGGVPRKFYLQALRERYPRSVIGTAPHTELGAIYSHSSIGFNYSIANDVNMRMFEVLASGALLVTNALSHDALERLGLRDGEHLVLYRRPQELFQRIDDFLAHPAARRAIADRGRQLVLTTHTYTHRMQHVLEALGMSRDSEPPRTREESRTCASS